MKKVLICLVLVVFLSITQAIAAPASTQIINKSNISDLKGTKIMFGQDNFDGRYWYYVPYNTRSKNLFENLYFANISFNLFYPNTSRNLVVQYKIDNIYAVDTLIRIKIDDVVWDLTTDPTSMKLRDGEAVTVWGLPDNFLAALLNTKKDITIRFTYRTLRGDYLKEIVFPYLTLQDVQKMYTVCQ